MAFFCRQNLHIWCMLEKFDGLDSSFKLQSFGQLGFKLSLRGKMVNTFQFS